MADLQYRFCGNILRGAAVWYVRRRIEFIGRDRAKLTRNCGRLLGNHSGSGLFWGDWELQQLG
ncbi:hypothetical protein C7B67_05680 [filamentous cyanobacterium Phorm 6]|nr:hypothetical protein C7B67_05680 [filamentous cyanobacterium Phorm 6]